MIVGVALLVLGGAGAGAHFFIDADTGTYPTKAWEHEAGGPGEYNCAGIPGWRDRRVLGACALLGGPVFGFAGHLWRSAARRLRGLGAAVLSSSLVAEGLWSYLLELHHGATAALWVAIGASVAILSARNRLTDLGWLAVTLLIGLIGEIALATVYRQSF